MSDERLKVVSFVDGLGKEYPDVARQVHRFTSLQEAIGAVRADHHYSGMVPGARFTADSMTGGETRGPAVPMELDAIGGYRKSKGDIRCFACNGFGHVKRVCPNNKSHGGKAKDFNGRSDSGHPKGRDQ